jgi:hypothetical protein
VAMAPAWRKPCCCVRSALLSSPSVTRPTHRDSTVTPSDGRTLHYEWSICSAIAAATPSSVQISGVPAGHNCRVRDQIRDQVGAAACFRSLIDMHELGGIATISSVSRHLKPLGACLKGFGLLLGPRAMQVRACIAAGSGLSVPDTPYNRRQHQRPGQSQSDLHWTSVGPVERGRRNLNLRNLLKLAKTLETDSAELSLVSAHARGPLRQLSALFSSRWPSQDNHRRQQKSHDRAVFQLGERGDAHRGVVEAANRRTPIRRR